MIHLWHIKGILYASDIKQKNVCTDVHNIHIGYSKTKLFGKDVETSTFMHIGGGREMIIII